MYIWLPAAAASVSNQQPSQTSEVLECFAPMCLCVILCFWSAHHKANSSCSLRSDQTVMHLCFASPTIPLCSACGHSKDTSACRIAIEQQSSLVPVLALGEALQLRNLINLPTLQQYTYKKIGFPVPFILCGRWFVTPFPHKIPLVYVIGKPLRPPKYKAGQPMKAEDVDCLHKQYYDSLADLFVRYKHLHPDFAEARMVLKDD
eukprot:GHRR01029903.1.p1 GENE.GHRR01029903.1~~GHRR01029903.1.p1  ORF type:complete len:204 (-),score=25.51 GHRR01029903.1:280-891(-)